MNDEHGRRLQVVVIAYLLAFALTVCGALHYLSETWKREDAELQRATQERS